MLLIFANIYQRNISYVVSVIKDKRYYEDCDNLEIVKWNVSVELYFIHVATRI